MTMSTGSRDHLDAVANLAKEPPAEANPQPVPPRFPLKAGLDPLPGKMSALPIDDRGYPIPFFVATLPNGDREFRAMDNEKMIRCVKEHLCWVCGEKLGKFMVFVIGPMCMINRINAEPPSHRECALYAVKNCPFLVNPRAERREGGVGRGFQGKLADGAGMLIKRNPGVSVLWTCLTYRVIHDGKDGVLFAIGDKPSNVEFFCEGKPANRTQIDESIASGLPNLLKACGSEDEIREVQRRALALEPMLPKAGIILGTST
jgi:hypothetical protein